MGETQAAQDGARTCGSLTPLLRTCAAVGMLVIGKGVVCVALSPVRGCVG